MAYGAMAWRGPRRREGFWGKRRDGGEEEEEGGDIEVRGVS